METTNPILVFDIETIPDIEAGRRLYHLPDDLSDEDVLQALTALRQEEVGNDFMRLPLHKIACISFLWVNEGSLTLKSLSLDKYTEEAMLATFFRAFNRDAAQLPTLVSFNGKGFDIPVMTYRALQYNLSVPNLFDEHSSGMRYNNYMSRYHDRHTDLMLKLSMGGIRQSLDTVACVCGFAGKQDIDGSMVLSLVQDKNWDALTTYCESDVLNTWLIYLRWLRLTGRMKADTMQEYVSHTRDYLHLLKDSDGNLVHQGFLDHWAIH